MSDRSIVTLSPVSVASGNFLLESGHRHGMNGDRSTANKFRFRKDEGSTIDRPKYGAGPARLDEPVPHIGHELAILIIAGNDEGVIQLCCVPQCSVAIHVNAVACLHGPAAIAEELPVEYTLTGIFIGEPQAIGGENDRIHRKKPQQHEADRYGHEITCRPDLTFSDMRRNNVKLRRQPTAILSATFMEALG